MKKLLLLAPVALLALASCKKDYSCNCTDTTSYDGITEIDVYTYSIEGASKDQAVAACNEATITYSEAGYSQKQECKLSK